MGRGGSRGGRSTNTRQASRLEAAFRPGCFSDQPPVWPSFSCSHLYLCSPQSKGQRCTAGLSRAGAVCRLQGVMVPRAACQASPGKREEKPGRRGTSWRWRQKTKACWRVLLRGGSSACEEAGAVTRCGSATLATNRCREPVSPITVLESAEPRKCQPPRDPPLLTRDSRCRKPAKRQRGARQGARALPSLGMAGRARGAWTMAKMRTP